MSTTPTAPPTSPWPRRALVACGLLAACVAVVALARQSIPDDAPPVAVAPIPAPPAPTEPDIPLRDMDPVIGVTLDTRHRAYRLADLWRPDQHVQNDLFGDVPVSVTFCNLDNCVRAFTDASRGKPLDIRMGGANPRKARTMLLSVAGVKYEQDTGEPLDTGGKPLPFAGVPAVRTTWGEWRTRYPDSEARVNGILYSPRTK